METIHDEIADAININQPDTVRSLMRDRDVNNLDMERILIWAANWGYSDIVEKIITSNRYNDDYDKVLTLKALVALMSHGDYSNFSDLLDLYLEYHYVKPQDKKYLFREALMVPIINRNSYIKKIIDSLKETLDVEQFSDILDMYITINDRETINDISTNVVDILINSYLETLSEDGLVKLIDQMIKRYQSDMVWNLLDMNINKISPDKIEPLIDNLIEYHNIDSITIIINVYGEQLSEESLNKIVLAAINDNYHYLLQDIVNRDLYFDRDEIYYGEGISQVIRKYLEIYDENQQQKKLILEKLTTSCNNDVDPISQMEFYKLPLSRVKNIFKLRNGNCYDYYTIYKYVEDKIKNNRPITDPLIPNYRINEQELSNLYDIMKRKNPNFVPPEFKQFQYPPNYQLKVNQEGDFYHIMLDDNYNEDDLGYIPANIDVNETGSTDLTSSVVISNIRKLWDMGRLLINNEDILSCCTIHLRKSIDYWYDQNGFIDINKFINMSREIFTLLD